MLAGCVVVALVIVKGRQKTSNGNYIIVICYIHTFSFFSENDDLAAASNEAIYGILNPELTVTSNEAIYGILNTEPAYEVISD